MIPQPVCEMCWFLSVIESSVRLVSKIVGLTEHCLMQVSHFDAGSEASANRSEGQTTSTVSSSLCTCTPMTIGFIFCVHPLSADRLPNCCYRHCSMFSVHDVKQLLLLLLLLLPLALLLLLQLQSYCNRSVAIKLCDFC
jgi:hypothetical protein